MWKLPNNSITRSPRNLNFDGMTIKSSDFKKGKEYLAKKGIFPFIEVRFDSKHYKSTGHSDTITNGEITRTHTITERMTVAELKTSRIAEIRPHAFSLLSPTDWMAIRKADTNKSVPTEISTYRSAVRQASEDIESYINVTFDDNTIADYKKLINFNPSSVDTGEKDGNGDPVMISMWPENLIEVKV